MISNIMGMIGLAQRAGKCLSGTELCVRAAKEGKAYRMLLDERAKDNTAAKISTACHGRDIPIYRVPGLGRAIGRENRVTCAIVDRKFAGAIEQRLKDCT